VTKVGGVTRELDATITEQHPDERVALMSTDGPDHGGSDHLPPHRGRQAQGHRADGDRPRRFRRNVADKLGALNRRIKADMRRFEEFIEKRGREAGSWRGDVDRSGN
jgi:hypothetical protein